MSAINDGVYVLRCSETGRYKIGYSSDVSDRIATLQTGSAPDLELALVVPGDREREHGLHALFAHRRDRGEWFRLTEDDLAIIAVMAPKDSRSTPDPLSPLRSHQLKAIAVAEEVAAGMRPGQKMIVAGITPGGGKTLMAALLAHVLANAGLIDRVIVVVPNDPLRRQMIESFHCPERGLDRFLRSPTANDVLAGTGRPFGPCVTYQMLAGGGDAKRIAKMAAEHKTLVIFDECHHMSENKAWERGAERIVAHAVLALNMSGTLWRWDEERIPFIPYDENQRAIVDIRYSRAEALSEKAILPIEFKLFDGSAIYSHRDVPHVTRLSSAPLREQARALRTALSSEDYVESFVVTALSDWERYREQHYPSSAIVVCHTKAAARRAYKLVRRVFPKHFAALSLSGEGAAADRAIKRFRSGDVTILVTVRKAYEGLDVPNASHLVCLTNIRSWPFLDQVIARVTRFNKHSTLPWEGQRGYVYMPDDLRARNYIENMLNEQDEYYRERAAPAPTGSGVDRGHSSFKPESSEVVSIGNGADGRILTDAENVGVQRLEERFPPLALRVPLLMKLEIARGLGLVPGEVADAAE